MFLATCSKAYGEGSRALTSIKNFILFHVTFPLFAQKVRTIRFKLNYICLSDKVIHPK